jgi:hypothetical protein
MKTFEEVVKLHINKITDAFNNLSLIDQIKYYSSHKLLCDELKIGGNIKESSLDELFSVYRQIKKPNPRSINFLKNLISDKFRKDFDTNKIPHYISELGIDTLVEIISVNPYKDANCMIIIKFILSDTSGKFGKAFADYNVRQPDFEYVLDIISRQYFNDKDLVIMFKWFSYVKDNSVYSTRLIESAFNRISKHYKRLPNSLKNEV